MTHNQLVQEGGTGSSGFTSGLTEIGLFDDAGGDPTNLIYLQTQCGALSGMAPGAEFAPAHLNKGHLDSQLLLI